MIDFRPNNAPLKDIARPSLEEISRLRQTEAVSRYQPAPRVSPKTSALFGVCMIVFCTLASLAIPILSEAGGKLVTRKASWMDRPKIRSIYVSVRLPSPELVTHLQELAAQGVDVRIVSGQPIQVTGATVGVVAPEHIDREGVMINGLSFYPLNP